MAGAYDDIQQKLKNERRDVAAWFPCHSTPSQWTCTKILQSPNFFAPPHPHLPPKKLCFLLQRIVLYALRGLKAVQSNWFLNLYFSHYFCFLWISYNLVFSLMFNMVMLAVPLLEFSKPDSLCVLFSHRHNLIFDKCMNAILIYECFGIHFIADDVK